MFYQIKPIKLGSTTYYAVFDNQLNTSSRLFKSYHDALQAMMDQVGDSDEVVFAHQIK